jgi:Mrp family chromosome partitioning ATPase
MQTIGEVNKVLGFPPLAWILERESHEHESLIFDQLRRLAMALYRDQQTNQTYCFALTSVKPDGGATTLTLELARRLSELGIRALALELNAFNPDSRYQDPLSRSREGVANVLAQDQWSPQQVERFIIPASNEMPARLPVGEVTDRHLITRGRLPALLAHLATLYDFILLDTPPILISADAELLGETGAGVLLVIEAGQVYPGELQRASHLLERLDPPVVAALLNRVKAFQGGGYFQDLMREYQTGTKQKPNWVKRLLWS